MMRYWLAKSEPEEWSWDDHWKKRSRVEAWTGVRNHQANNNLKAMSPGDQVFFYHSGKQRAIVGIMEVIKAWQPDPNDDTGRWGFVNMKAAQPLPEPVTLGQIKQESALKEMALVRNSRLSVMPVSKDAWQRICQMGGIGE